MSADDTPASGDSRGPGEDIALTIVQDGEKRYVTVRELTVGNKLAADALLSLLVEKGIITAEEFHDRIRQLQKNHYRPGRPAAGDDMPSDQ